MGNQTSQLPPTGRVILQDGSIQEFDSPLTVAELMLEYPQQMVVELRHGCDQSKPIPLPADKKLEFHKIYVMAPLRRGRAPTHLPPLDAHNIVVSKDVNYCSEFKLDDEGVEEVCLSRQFSNRGWKPNLDPIVEKKDEINRGFKLVVIVGKVGKRIHSKGLVWG